MGECRLHITLLNLASSSKPLLEEDDDEQQIGTERIQTSSFVHVVSADSTLGDVTCYVETKLLWNKYCFDTKDTNTKQISLTMYNATLYPPQKMMMPTCLDKTLFALGLFPSARLVITDDDKWTSQKSQLLLEDFQYNLPESILQKKGGGDRPASSVQPAAAYNGETRLLPSQVFQAVQLSRSTDSDRNTTPTTTSVGATVKAKKRTEEERRHARFDAALDKLDSKKASKVSEQVKKMLIQSQSHGDKSIRQEARFFVETVVMTGDSPHHDDTVKHQYFSRVATIGKISTTIAQGENKTVEILVARPDKNGVGGIVYARLPMTLAFHEAEARGYLKNFDRVFVRVLENDGLSSVSVLDDETDNNYNDTKKDRSSTLCVLADEIDDDYDNNKKESGDSNVEGKEVKKGVGDTDVLNNSDTMTVDGDLSKTTTVLKSNPNHTFLQQIEFAVQAMDRQSTKGKNKRKSASVDKVRQMLIKGKAKGEGVKEIDRFFLEVIVVNIASLVAKSHYIFVSQWANVGKVVSQCKEIVNEENSYFLVMENDSDLTFRRLSLSMRICDAEKKGHLHPFDRVIIGRCEEESLLPPYSD